MPWLALSARFALLGLSLTASSAALAYVGPGAGLGILGVAVAVLAAVVMGLFGLVMWPIRKLAQQRKAHAGEPSDERSASRRSDLRDGTKRLGSEERR